MVLVLKYEIKVLTYFEIVFVKPFINSYFELCKSIFYLTHFFMPFYSVPKIAMKVSWRPSKSFLTITQYKKMDLFQETFLIPWKPMS